MIRGPVAKVVLAHRGVPKSQPAALMISDSRNFWRASRSISRTRSPDRPMILPTLRKVMACPFPSPYRSTRPTLSGVQLVRQGLADPLPEHGVLHGIGQALLICQQVPELGVLTHWKLKRERLPALDLDQPLHLLDGKAHPLGQLLGGGLAPVCLAELGADPAEDPNPVVDMDGNRIGGLGRRWPG